jgi:hypothetical protein
MAADYFFQELRKNQQRTLNRAAAAYQGYQEALQASLPLKGGMHWKKIKGREYLYKYRDRYGHGESLGPRSVDTERIFSEFGGRRREMTARLAGRRQELAEAARFCRAALIHRVPEAVTRILRRLATGDLAGTPPVVIDTHALHAYEFATGVFIGAPRGSPLWTGAAQGLTLAATAMVPPDTFLRFLRQGDRSYQAFPGDGLMAVNRQGFRVRLVHPPTTRSPHRMLVKDDAGFTVPAESGDLAALVGAPKFSQVVIGRRGEPVTMTVPDPRAMALHKLWLSQQEGRGPVKQTRDRCQAAALAELVLRYLPQYYFFSAELQWFPAEVARLAENLVEGYEVPPDLEMDS